MHTIRLNHNSPARAFIAVYFAMQKTVERENHMFCKMFVHTRRRIKRFKKYVIKKILHNLHILELL